MKSMLVIDTPETCGDCSLCIFSAEEKRCMGYYNTSNEDYYCKTLDRFMEYDKVDGGVDILGKPIDCPLEIFEPQESEDTELTYKEKSAIVIEQLRADRDRLLGVFEKIRTEINTMPCAITSMREIYVNRDKVIDILDKYKAESEDSE